MAESWHRGDWMQTYSGLQFYPLDPRAADIDILDISHALSNLCRYAGHVERFYSVAEHCVLLSYAVDPSKALHALLHDATEAYVVDVPRPLKVSLPEYQAIEHEVWMQIARRFNIAPVLPHEVKDADTRILLDERRALMRRGTHRWAVDVMEPLGVQIEGWSPTKAKARYLRRFQELTGAEG